MAVDETNFIFTSDDGGPLVFFIRPSETKARLRTLIEKAGGVVTSKPSGKEDHIIRIASDNDLVTGEGYIKAQYVEECLANGKLLETEDFECQAQSKRPTAEPGASHIMNSISVTGRMKYTEEEDRAILEYVAKHPVKYGGNAMWKRMEAMKVTNHTWQSMRDRFTKRLSGRLQEYIELCESGMDASGEGDDPEVVPDTDEEEDSIPEVCAPTDYNHFVFNYLKGIKDQEPDLEVTEEPNGIEQQVIDEVERLCQEFNLSKKAIAMAIDLNSGDMSKTEQFLREESLSPDVRVWSHQDDASLLRGERHSGLCLKYGKKSVQSRQAFLDGGGDDIS